MTFWAYRIYVSGEYVVPEDSEQHWDPDAYERAVIEILERLSWTAAGEIVFRNIAMEVGIVPRSRLRDMQGASAIPFDPRSGRTSDPRSSSLLRGRGDGSQVLITFTPGMWPRGMSGRRPHEGLALYTDEAVLYHELVHALHYTLGRSASRLLPAPYISVEENRAVLASNVLLSELHYPLRAEYQHNAPFSSTHSSGRDWYGYRYGTEASGLSSLALGSVPIPAERVEFEAQQVAEYVRDVPAFTHDLAGLSQSRCRYNPFRSYLEHRYEDIPLHWSSWCAGPCT